jgi:hypothetical protein
MSAGVKVISEIKYFCCTCCVAHEREWEMNWHLLFIAIHYFRFLMGTHMVVCQIYTPKREN